MFRKISIAFIALLLVASCTWFYFHLRRAKEPVNNALSAIPQDASFILETRQVQNLFHRVNESNIIWQDLMTVGSFASLQSNLHFLDSLISNNADMSALLEGHSLYISSHPAEQGSNYLLAFALPDKALKEKIEEFIRSRFSVRQQQSDIAVLSTASRREVCFYAFSQGILLLSPSESLVLKAVGQSKAMHSLLDNKRFASAASTSKSSGSDFRFYCNYSQKSLFLNTFLEPSFAEKLKQQGNFSGWTALDGSVRAKSLVLNGFTEAKRDSDFLDLFRGQDPQVPEALSMMPSNTASFLYFGYSDFHSFYQNYSRLRSSSATGFLDSINKRYDSDLATDFASWTENETAVVTTEPSTESTDFSACNFVLLRSNNMDRAQKALAELCKLVCKTDSVKTDTFSFGKHQIGQLKIQGILPALFGTEYAVRENYYAVCGNYFLFGNSLAALKSYLNAIDADRTLNQDSHYNEFSANLSSKCNVYFYSNIARSRLIYARNASTSYASSITQNTDLLIRFEALGVQFSSQGALFYNDIYLEENPIYKKETASLWETKLDTTFSGRPALLLNHMTNTLDIFVQDEANKIYLISNTGKILWSRQLPEKILSDIHQVDAFKNKKLQLIFNTRSRIYLMDRNGKDLGGYPIQLPFPATNALAVLDYDKSFDYRILIACADKRIRNYSIKGKPVDGWKPTQTSDSITALIQYCSAEGKDYILTADIQGQIYALDRHGEIRFSLKDRLPAPLNVFNLEKGKDPAHIKILASDSLGNITRISLAGKTEHITFKPFGKHSHFLYHDLNADKSPEFIFLDENELSVFTEDKSLLFSYTFNDTINQAPFILSYPDHHNRIGLVSDKNDELYLINEAGLLPSGFPVRGRTAFDIGTINNDDAHILICGEGKNIYAYSVP